MGLSYDSKYNAADIRLRDKVEEFDDLLELRKVKEKEKTKKSISLDEVKMLLNL